MSNNLDLINEFKRMIGNVLNEDIDDQAIISIHVSPEGVSSKTILDISGELRAVEKGSNGFRMDENGEPDGWYRYVDMPSYSGLLDEDLKLKKIDFKLDAAVENGKFTPEEAKQARDQIKTRQKEIKKELSKMQSPWDKFMPWFVGILEKLGMQPYPAYGFKDEDNWKAWDVTSRDFPDSEQYSAKDSGRIITSKEFSIYDEVPEDYVPPKSFLARHVKIEIESLGDTQEEALKGLWYILNHEMVEKLDWMSLKKSDSTSSVRILTRVEEFGYENLEGVNIGRPPLVMGKGDDEETIEFPDEVVQKGETAEEVKARLARSSMAQNAAIKSKLSSARAKRAYLSNIEKKTNIGEYQDQIDTEVKRIAQEAEDYFGVGEDITKKALQKLIAGYGLMIPDIEFITNPHASKEVLSLLKGRGKKDPLDALDIRSLLEHTNRWANAVINDSIDANKLYNKVLSESNYASGKFDTTIDSVVYKIKSNKNKIESYKELFDEDVLKSIDMAIDGIKHNEIVESCGSYLSEDQVMKLNNQIFEGENLIGIMNHVDAVLKSRELVEHSNFLFGTVVHNLGIGDIKYFSDLVPSSISGPEYSDLNSFLQDKGIDYESVVADSREGNVVSKNIVAGGI